MRVWLVCFVVAACAAPPPARTPFGLRRVVLYQNGMGHFERAGAVLSDTALLEMGAHEVDDVLETLTVVTDARNADRRRTGVEAIAPRRVAGAKTAVIAIRFGRRPVGDVSLAYAVPTPTWRASYRIVLPERRADRSGWLQAWALVHNLSGEDWRQVHLTLASGGPISYAVDLQSPRFVPRPDATGRLVAPTAVGVVASERSENGDQDHDAIADVDDLCPGEDEDVDRFEDRDGCADTDNDQDRIPDAADRCPNDPEVYNGLEDEDGCPDHGRIVVEENQIVILDRIFFPAGTARMGADNPVLRAVAETLRGNPQIARVEVSGHADRSEPDPWALSAERARAVVDALVAAGVSPARLRAISAGTTRSMGADPERNRRVEFHIEETDEGRTGAARAPAAPAAIRAESLSRSVRPGTTLHEVPGGTQYTLAQPVSIPAGASTLVTMLDRRIDAEDVLLWRPGPEMPGSDRHPLRAARLHNDTGLDFVGGPVALYGRGAFVGEGLLDGLAAGEVAFVPYALDASTDVEVDSERQEVPAGIVSAVRGVVTLESSAVVRTRYLVRVGRHAPGRLFLRHSRATGYEPTSIPPGTARTADALLVPVPVAPGERSVVEIEERLPVRRAVEVLADERTDLAPYLSARPLPAGPAGAVGDVVRERLRLGRLSQEIDSVRERLVDAGRRSAELRQNIREVGRAGAGGLRARLLARLREATDSSERLSAHLAELTVARTDARTRLEDAVEQMVMPLTP